MNIRAARSLAVVWSFVCFLLASSAYGSAVGHTPGEFSVGQSGEATYRIPLSVPPGVAGISPDLALLYNSSAPNGQLGVGWSISGLSAVTRCPATVAQDGTPGVVNYSSGDKYCIDGQRLKLISGTYGAHNSRYRTEIDTFQDIRAYDDNADGHVDRFVSKDKAGLLRTYGYSAHAEIEAQGKPYMRVWPLYKVADKFNNNMYVIYTKKVAAGERGEYWPRYLIYRNRNGSMVGRVNFLWTSSRPDKHYGYTYGGSMESRTYRMTGVDVFGHDGPTGGSSSELVRIRRYNFKYEQNTANGASQLKEVEECDSSLTLCLEPTTIKYFHGENGFNTNNYATLPARGSNQFMDVNGDGRPDQVYEEGWRWRIRLSGSHSTVRTTPISSSPHARESRYTRVIDYNGDGKQDLLVANTSTGRWNVLQSTGTSFVQIDTYRQHYNAHQRQPLVVDLDGDALPEIVFKRGNTLQIYRNTGGAFHPTAVNTYLTVSNDQVLTPLEFDGDGRVDLLVNRDGCSNPSSGGGGPGNPDNPIFPRGSGPGSAIQPIDPVDPSLPNGNAPTATDRGGGGATRNTSHCSETAGILTWNPATQNLRRITMSGYTNTAGIGGNNNYSQLLDFNGDGLTDLALAPSNDSGRWAFYLNKGRSWQLQWQGHNGRYRHLATVFDYDGDGRQELWQPNNNRWYRLRPNVSQLSTSFTVINTMPFVSDSGFFMDWTGDGLPDQVIAQGGSFYIRTHKGTKRGLLKSIENGLGDETQVSYASLSDVAVGDVYGGESGSPTFPERHFRGPLYLVRSFAADSGRLSNSGSDLKVTTNYTYEGAKVHQQGRGFLGFSKIEAHNVNTQIVTHNTHSQTFPYIGMVTKSEQWTPDTVIVDTDWSDIDDDFVPCNPSQGPCTQPRATADEVRGGKGNAAVTSQRNTVVPGERLSETINTLNRKIFGGNTVSERYFPYVSRSIEKTFKFRSAALVKRTITDTGYDNWGNATTVNVTIDNGSGGHTHKVSTTNTYDNWTDSRWCLGRLTNATVTHQRANYGGGGPTTATRTSTFGYNTSHCQLTQETTEPNNTALKLVKTYGYDVFGNRTSVTTSGGGIATRTSSVAYDAFGQYPIRSTNALGHQQTTSWDYAHGNKASVTDANGFTNTYLYDTFGRQTREISPRAAAWSEKLPAWCDASSCDHPDAVFKITSRVPTVTASGNVQSIVEFDQLGREILSKTRAFDGRYIYADTIYDLAGRAFAKSTPHYSNEVACWTVNEYDNIGRIIAEHKPANDQECNSFGNSVPSVHNISAVDSAYSATTIYYYDGLETRVVDPHGREMTRKVNVVDRLISVSERDDDSVLLETKYDYDPLGNMTWVRDPGGNVSRMTYDTRGNKVSMDDPDMGHWEYDYNALGELLWQKDAKNQVVTMEYDKLGRMTRRVEPEGASAWHYDSSVFGSNSNYHGKAIGKLTRVAGPNGFEERYRYLGPYGELRYKYDRLDGKWYTYIFNQDGLGRTHSRYLPSVNTAQYGNSTKMLRVITAFNAYGYPYLTREYRDGAYRTRFWRARTMDALGNVTSEETHNGTVITNRIYDRATGLLEDVVAGNNGVIQNEEYTWDAIGNLTRRADLNKGWSERFEYDKLYRLKQVSLSTSITGSGSVTARNKYDAVGNLLCKDVNSVSGTCSGGYRNYLYGTTNTASNANDGGPHAVKSIWTDAGTRTYSYDNNGNLKTVSGGGANRSATWYTFNKLKRVSRGSDWSEFQYRPDRGRYKQTSVQSGVTTTTYYVGGSYERKVKSGSPDEHIYYIRAGGQGRVVAQVKRYGTSVLPTTEQYFHRDHLGSIVAVTNDAGGVYERMSYDAWGKRRNLSNWVTPGLNSFALYTATQRGFTGHEHMDNMGLINMNGRIYDFEIGRFLSADPYVQYPESTQGFNRYTYVQNNPLSYNDPSGFFLKKLMKVVGTVLSFIPVTSWAGLLIKGFMVGFLGSGGDLKAGLLGAIGGGLFGGIAGIEGLSSFSGAVLRGLVGGAMSVAGGGRFGNGFLGAFGGSFARGITDRFSIGGVGPLKASYNTLLSATVGGTVSKIGGGKFANGAVSASFRAVAKNSASPNGAPPEDETTDAGGLELDPDLSERSKALAEEIGRDGERIATVGGILDDDNSEKFVAGRSILLKPSSTTIGMENFVYRVNYHVLDRAGNVIPSVSKESYWRSYGATTGQGGGGPDRHITLPYGPETRIQWHIYIPAQASTHDNSGWRTIEVYSARPGG